MSEACSRSRARHSAWRVPRVTSSAASLPRSRRSRAAISSAALLVKVTAQIRRGGMFSERTRCPIRPIRQNVLPAPGPATTSTGPAGASMARRWAGVGTGPDPKAGVASIPVVAVIGQRYFAGVTLAVRIDRPGVELRPVQLLFDPVKGVVPDGAVRAKLQQPAPFG